MKPRRIRIITMHDGEIPAFVPYGIYIEVTPEGTQMDTEFTVDLTDEQLEEVKALPGFAGVLEG